MQTLLDSYKAACRNLDRAHDTWHDLLTTGDKRAIKAALVVVDHYRGAQEEAFQAWRQTWEDA